MENSICKLGAYLPILIVLSLLIFAFANVMNERLRRQISRQCLYFFSALMYLLSFVGYVLYLSSDSNQIWIIFVIVGAVISAVFVAVTEMIFEKILKK